MSFDEFYIYWYPKMYRFAREYIIYEEDAEDIIQDVFLKLYEIYDTLSLSYGMNMNAYMFASVKNQCIDFLRRKIIDQKSKEIIKEKELLVLRMKYDSLEVLDNDLFDKKDIETILEEALKVLPERCREILIMHKIEGLKQKDIALALNISPKTIQNQLTIAYKKLREEFEKHPDLFSLLIFFNIITLGDF
jgi:RNA polymerase sigma-70 factor, Bacteroides expansion family 1